MSYVIRMADDDMSDIRNVMRDWFQRPGTNVSYAPVAPKKKKKKPKTANKKKRKITSTGPSRRNFKKAVKKQKANSIRRHVKQPFAIAFNSDVPIMIRPTARSGPHPLNEEEQIWLYEVLSSRDRARLGRLR
jgi:hypothetical protein